MIFNGGTQISFENKLADFPNRTPRTPGPNFLLEPKAKRRVDADARPKRASTRRFVKTGGKRATDEREKRRSRSANERRFDANRIGENRNPRRTPIDAGRFVRDNRLRRRQAKSARVACEPPRTPSPKKNRRRRSGNAALAKRYKRREIAKAKNRTPRTAKNAPQFLLVKKSYVKFKKTSLFLNPRNASSVWSITPIF